MSEVGATHEEGLASFVIRQRRDRFRQQIVSARNRGKVLERLHHFPDWDERYVVPLRGGDQTSTTIARKLRELGAPAACWIVSSDSKFDGTSNTLDAAVKAIIGSVEGTVISCLPGRLAYYEGEDPGRRFILFRPSEPARAPGSDAHR